MEFFARARTGMRESDLQREVRVDNLDQWCGCIDRVLSHRGEKGEIYCVWGEFRVHREVIREGVRFTLPTCPNALQWTLTLDKAQPGSIVVHCTINQHSQDADFVESLQQFVDDWCAGLEAGAGHDAPRAAPGECMPWYG